MPLHPERPEAAQHRGEEELELRTRRTVATMLQQAKSAVGVAARRLGRSLDGMGAALETHPYTEKCKRERATTHRERERDIEEGGGRGGLCWACTHPLSVGVVAALTCP